MERAVREMTFDEEYEILKQEFEKIIEEEDEHSEPSFKNCVLRRAMRCIRKQGEELKAYKDLDEQGLLLKLPCKVGDKVYYPDKNWCRVFEYSVVSVAKDSTNIWIRCGNGYSFIYGREIFTTLAEAEKALAEMEK